MIPNHERFCNYWHYRCLCFFLSGLYPDLSGEILMIFNFIEIFLFALLLIAITYFLGSYISDIYLQKPRWAKILFEWLENLCYRLAGVNANEEMGWKEYVKSLLLFNFIGFIALFFLLLFQHLLPLNPQKFPGVPWPLAFNIAASFVTNTNWQSYAGETTLSYFSQMVGLTVQNFLSAATGLAALIALLRGISRKSSETIGNFWTDLVRSVVYIFLPLSIILSIVLIGEGVVQTLSPYVEVATLENGNQIIPLGPTASQVAIKQLGTNGGGFFNTNSAHPFENPTALSNFFEMLSLMMIPAALTLTYGKMIGSRRQGWLLFWLMFLLWFLGLLLSNFSENLLNPSLGNLSFLEGKETRFGPTFSILWSTSTTATANGSVNTMLDSLSPLSGGVALFNMMVGEVIFGGIGTGLAGMIMFVILTVFLSGLMVGRTPEYLGKKIEKREMQWVVVAILTPGFLMLLGSGMTCMLKNALLSLANKGPHGLTEILYAFTSASANNGSSFAGLNANTDYYNLLIGIIMLLARIAIIVPSLAIAGLLARKRYTPPCQGTFTTDNALFFILLLCVVIIIGALTFFPALSLGPISEQILMLKGKTF